MASVSPSAHIDVHGKKVMLLTRRDGTTLVRFVNAIRQAGCNVVLVATALGYNYSLRDSHYDDLGDRIRTVYTTLVDPPPVVTVTGISQLLPFLQAADPDLVISWFFPYQLTKSFLAHRSIKINLHPSPLPLFKGNNALPRAILEQMSYWGVTWHYIGDGYDTGNILVQECYELKPPYGISDLSSKHYELAFTTLSKAIEMSLSGHPGTPQRQLTPEEEPYADPKPLTIAERTLRSGMSCQQVWILVEACKFFAPVLLNVEERLYQVREARRLETPLPFSLALGEIRRVLTRFVQQCTDGQMEYVVRIV